jgi:phosphate acetyltransferase
LAGADIPTFAVPEVALLSAPTMGELCTALDGTVYSGDPELLRREVLGVMVGGMTAENILDRLIEGQVVIVPADRSDVLLALVNAHEAQGFPSLAGIILNGGLLPHPAIDKLVKGLRPTLPLIATSHRTYDTAEMVSNTGSKITVGALRKIDTALALMAAHVDGVELAERLRVPQSTVVTPQMFEYRLLERARRDRRHIVLPEATDDRILLAAGRLLSRGIVDLTLLGVEGAVRRRGAELGVDLDAARVIDPASSELQGRFAAEYTRLRAHRGMTEERAGEIMRDISYFGTMMVHLGLADGMVSGAAHTTAHTIRPAFEIIRTAPGVSTVSSVFLMCLSDRVLAYGDCAVVPDPTIEQLADIAISSAATAAAFGIEPRVALLSYSTGESGSGAGVDKVRAATQLVQQRRPDLLADGPIQYDAAVDEGVAAVKMPESKVAGRATVLVFPDLNTGNNTYKAVQRSAGAIAIGPVLQGLAKPVNDLSRGALVDDIVYTVAITAIQAQEVAR